MISLHSILSILYLQIRPLIKWFLRKTTKLCELQRICYGQKPGAPRTLAVEKSLLLSKNSHLRELHLTKTSQKTAVMYVLSVKKINVMNHFQFVISFGKCIQQIWDYVNLVEAIEDLRKTMYDFTNQVHEEKLYKLWTLLVPDQKLESRVTKQWQFIGFQGDDPKTDFRGMGILGLENLLYFASEYRNIAQKILLKSQHPKHGYAFAIVGINLTHLTYHLVKDGTAKTHMYNASKNTINGHINMVTFHQLYSYLYLEFDNFWTISKPNDIMDFSFIRDKFEKNIRESLSNPMTLFKINAVVDEI